MKKHQMCSQGIKAICSLRSVWDQILFFYCLGQGKLISLYQVVPSGQKGEAAYLEPNKPDMGAEFLEFANKPNMGANKPNMGAHSLKI